MATLQVLLGFLGVGGGEIFLLLASYPTCGFGLQALPKSGSWAWEKGIQEEFKDARRAASDTKEEEKK